MKYFTALQSSVEKGQSRAKRRASKIMIKRKNAVSMAIKSVSTIMIWLALSGCRSSPKIIRVDLIDRTDVAAPDKKTNPRLLVVALDENGRLSLNKIETGTIADPADLNEKLRVVFDDREKAGIDERAVVVDPQTGVKNEDLEKLIENLAAAKAAPLRVIRNKP